MSSHQNIYFTPLSLYRQRTQKRSTDEQINHTMEQSIELFIEQSSAVTRVATAPLSVTCQKKTRKKQHKKCCSVQFKHLNNPPAEPDRNKAAHLSASCFPLFLSSLANQLCPSHNATPSVPGVVSFGAWLWRVYFVCVCAAKVFNTHTSHMSAHFACANLHAYSMRAYCNFYLLMFLTCVRDVRRLMSALKDRCHHVTLQSTLSRSDRGDFTVVSSPIDAWWP